MPLQKNAPRKDDIMMDANEMAKQQELEKIKKTVMLKILSKSAYERLGRIKAVKPEMALQLELYLLQLYQSGQIGGQINDEQLKQMLDSLVQKKEFRIRRI